MSDTKVKPSWKEWDELLVDAWIKNASTMAMVVIQFLNPRGMAENSFSGDKLSKIFEEIGVTSRSPKDLHQLLCPVRAFFYAFFPEANNLLWDNKTQEALKVLRKYKIKHGAHVKPPRELDRMRREQKRKQGTTDFPLISGTNAMHISAARTAAADWNTVKPPGRMRPRKAA